MLQRVEVVEAGKSKSIVNIKRVQISMYLDKLPGNVAGVALMVVTAMEVY